MPASCPANIRETKIAWGYVPQADLATANTLSEIWSLTKVNPSMATVNPITEDDSQDIGKGDEFAANVYKTSVDTAVPIEKFTSSEAAAWAFCFATGKATKSGTAPSFTYVAVPGDPVVNCINLPPFTYYEQIRPTPNSVVDHGLIGCVINSFGLTMESGPGRANCKLAVAAVGTGKLAVPSAIVLPANTAEHFLNAASATINIGGIDYILNQSFISFAFNWNNNVRLASGYYPGSGTQNGFAVRGRMEYSTREFTCEFKARAQPGSPEFLQLISLAEHTFAVTLTGGLIGAGPAAHSLSITAPRTVLSSVITGDTEGIVDVTCQVRFLKPVTGDIITMQAVCSQDKILNL